MAWIGKLVVGFVVFIGSIFGGPHVSAPVATTTQDHTDTIVSTSKNPAPQAQAQQPVPVATPTSSTSSSVFTPSVVTQTGTLRHEEFDYSLVGNANCVPSTCVIPSDVAAAGISYLQELLGPEYVSKYIVFSKGDSESMNNGQGYDYWELGYVDTRFKQLGNTNMTYLLDINPTTKAVTSQTDIPDCVSASELCETSVTRQQSLDEASLNGFQTSSSEFTDAIAVGGTNGPGWFWVLTQTTPINNGCKNSVRQLTINIGTGQVSPLATGTTPCQYSSF